MNNRDSYSQHTITIYRDHYNDLLAELRHSRIDQQETGGELFGLFTADNQPVVLYFISAGPKAKRTQYEFAQDIPWLQKIGPKICQFGLCHIGEWHTHVDAEAVPSERDNDAIMSHISETPGGTFLQIIGGVEEGKPVLRAYRYHEYTSSPDEMEWLIVDDYSPFNVIEDNGYEPMGVDDEY